MSMRPGKYYVGDLCYVMDDEWDDVCSLIIQGNECVDGEFTLPDGRRFASYGTMYGDGGSAGFSRIARTDPSSARSSTP